MREPFAEQKVVITGAAGVYGTELAHAFAAAGARVCLSDVRAGALAALVATLGLPDDRVIAHALDLTDADAIHRFISLVSSAWGAPDVVVNNAGIYPFAGLLATDVSLWDRVMDTNLRAPFLLMQGFGRAMRDAGVRGAFINVSSGSAENLRTNGVPYCVSKRGLEWLSQGFALDLARDGIRVNCVRPGFATGSALVDWPPGYVDTMRAANPMGRTAMPGDLAGAVMFLASRASDYITGACLPVDGGSSIPRRSGAATEASR
ncbi:MAG: SDR family oxidoreductase [Vicinamibacterales bacterium]